MTRRETEWPNLTPTSGDPIILPEAEEGSRSADTDADAATSEAATAEAISLQEGPVENASVEDTSPHAALPSDDGHDPEEPDGVTSDEDPAIATPAVAVHVADPALRRRLAPWAIVVGALAIVGGVGVGASYTPVFEAKTILVKGEHHLARSQVLKLAHLSNATNLLHADLGAAERRLERNPWVQDAQVSRSLPSTLKVDLTERVPAAHIGVGSSLILVAADGTDLGTTARSNDLPRVLSLGSTDAPTGEALVAGAEVAGALPVDLRPAVATVSVGGDGAILLILRSGVSVTYGDGSEAVAKGEALRAILAYAQDQRLSLDSVDVTVPEAPTATLASGASVIPVR
jgi:cell division protein FtsQ